MTDQSDWKTIELFGAGAIDRVCAIYEISDLRVPGTKFKVKVLERSIGDFIAVPNVYLRLADGTPDYISGIAKTQIEALRDLLKRFMPSLSRVTTDDSEQFEWADPHDF